MRGGLKIGLASEAVTNKETLISQVKTPNKGDWTSEKKRKRKNILKDLKINHTFEEIESISKKNLSIIVQNAVQKHAFEYLIAIQKQKHKERSIEY